VAVQREIEMTGLSTVLITLSPEASLQAGPPRLLWPKSFELGHALGLPNQPELQRRVLRDALQLLNTPMEPATLVEREYTATI
jgi:D-proline reductase (dithiol) PrdB